MKKLILSAFLIAGLSSMNSLSAQQMHSDPNAPVIAFEKDTIDYGTVAYASDGTRYFTFINTGKEPLIISEAHGSCGCTIPTAPKEPIQPGQKAQIKVHYDTQRGGQSFFKTVTITSNASEGIKTVYIKGTVLADATASVSK
ncbi:MAG TPA: DUF1573 domain-containing protein [Bacteroidia bacterium]|nr:DUF1573 domain-containing protein [Bacteroidia bacterium]